MQKMPGLLLGVMDGGSLEQRVLQLLDRRPPWARRWRIASTAACALALGAATLSAGVFAVRAQQRAFDVIVIKRNDTGTAGLHRWGVDSQGYSVLNGPVAGLILQAYLSKPNEAATISRERLQGAPEWVTKQFYDITAKADGPTIAAMKDMNKTEQTAFEAPMLRSMFEDRFKIVAHASTADVPGYNLVVGKSGMKMTEVRPDEPMPPAGMDFGYGWKEFNLRTPEGKIYATRYVHVTMARFAAMTKDGSTPVVDKTGLTATYNFDLPYLTEPDSSAPRPDIAHRYDWGAIGLEMQPTKVSVPIVVVDHIEKPTEN